MTIHARIANIISSHTEIVPDKIYPELTLAELGADSLQTLEIIIGLEEEFECEITESQFEKMKSVQDIINFMEKTEKCHVTLQ